MVVKMTDFLFFFFVIVGPLRQTKGVFGTRQPVAEQQGFIDVGEFGGVLSKDALYISLRASRSVRSHFGVDIMRSS